MKYFAFLVILFHSTLVCNAQTNKALTSDNIKEKKYPKPNELNSFDFISLTEAENILEKPALLKDSTYRLSSGLMRYSLKYVAIYKDSTSKGQLLLFLEQHKDTLNSKDIYSFIKKQQLNNPTLTALNDLGDEGFYFRDSSNYPFIMVRKGTKIYKLQIFYLTDNESLTALLNQARKIVLNH